MSKFEELCEAYRAVNAEYFSYRNDCMELIGQLAIGLREYLDAPEGAVNLFAKGGAYAGRKVDGPLAAMHLADDTFWHFGVAIDIHQEEGMIPIHCVGFDMRLKQIGRKFILHVEGGPPFEVSQENPESIAQVYEFIFQFIKSRYETTFREFVIEGDATRRFGF